MEKPTPAIPRPYAPWLGDGETWDEYCDRCYLARHAATMARQLPLFLNPGELAKKPDMRIKGESS